MNRDEIVRRAFETFRADADAVPPLTLRGGQAVDGYDEPEPYDEARDDPSDTYLEHFTFWGLIYLDAQSWRHYLPRLIDYAFRRPDDPAMVVEALIASLRPPDRYPPRLATLTSDQEAVVAAFLETLALADDAADLRGDAQQALEEWWLPNPRHRPPAEQLAILRSSPMSYRVIEQPLYRLSLPASLTSSGPRDIPEEARLVEVWGGVVCGDVPIVVAVNVTPAAVRHLDDVLARAASGLRAASVEPRPINVANARRARRLDGLTRGDSPAEPQRISIVGAVADQEVVLLTVRSWPRADVDAEAERIVSSFAITAPRLAGQD